MPSVEGREATPYDAERLTTFTCSRGAAYEVEVEHYVRAEAMSAAQRARREGTGYRLLVFECPNRELVAVGAHQPASLRLSEGAGVRGIKLIVLAVALPFQGAELASGERLSDALLRALIADAIQHHRRDAFLAIVARDNYRSRRLCERNGFTTQLEYGTRYLALLGRFRA